MTPSDLKESGLRLLKKGRKGCGQKKEAYIYRVCLEQQAGAQ